MPGSRSPEVRQRMAARAVHADELASKVGELRLAGLTFRSIAESLGCSPSSASEAWRRFRRSLVRGSVDQERDVLLGRCEKLLRQLASKLVTGDVQAVRAATEVLRLMADVGGYAMPAQVAVEMNQMPVTAIQFVVQEDSHEGSKCDCWFCNGRSTVMEPVACRCLGKCPCEKCARVRVPLLKPAETVEPVEVG